ncbi:hypothetical protein E5206_12740 [Arthrobacter sp. PAMC25564]|uniref:hypothetical protein n=1 Tax=Arthrobacter sp. PAMC25564 TaxID=2565366 RepID=UPI0010A28ABB|nr:hypothetical protein [Arthrobacter sp. PAMC25564]QCB97678.1 hypothetical protein E5206_12740 [Arthrobacter sp. PAMC25564]
MSIHIRNIPNDDPNDDLVALTPQLAGLHIQTGSTDHNGRLVSGNIESAKAMPDGRIAIRLTRYMNGRHVLDSVTVPSGNDQLGRPWRTAVHVREDSQLFAALEAAA